MFPKQIIHFNRVFHFHHPFWGHVPLFLGNTHHIPPPPLTTLKSPQLFNWGRICSLNSWWPTPSKLVRRCHGFVMGFGEMLQVSDNGGCNLMPTNCKVKFERFLLEYIVHCLGWFPIYLKVKIDGDSRYQKVGDCKGAKNKPICRDG